LISLLFGGWGNVDAASFRSGLKLVGNRHIVTEQTVSRHLSANNSGQNGARVQSNTHLMETKV
jgi:hypothetical protein